MNFNTEMKKVSEMDEESAVSYDEQVDDTEGDVTARKRLMMGVILLTFAALVAVIVLAVLVGKENNKDDVILMNVMSRTETITTTAVPSIQVEIPNVGIVFGKSFQSDSVEGYLGIPYGETTAPPNRWKPPVEKQWPDNTMIDATNFGPGCVADNEIDTSEDCLFLNVWRPSNANTSKNPVMVWIHGGGFRSGNSARYSADKLVERSTNVDQAGRKPVIVVTLNYRLSVFGFMASKELLRDGVNATGNYGLMDQLLALKWVKNNIESFGGDPAAITVFGQSAGATSITNLLMIEETFNYISGAIMQSGFNTGYFNTMDSSEVIFNNILSDSGCSNVTCLEDLKASEVPTLQTYFKPVLDGVLLPELFGDANTVLEENLANNRIPLVMGTTRDEYAFFLPTDATAAEWNETNYESTVTSFLPQSETSSWVTRISDTYSTLSYPDGEYNSLWWKSCWASGDSLFEAPTRRAIMSADISATDASTKPLRYRYFFDMPTETQTPIVGSGAGSVLVPHASDLPFVFGCSDYQGVDRNESSCSWDTPQDERLSNDWSGWWLDFARTGSLPSPWVPHDVSGEGKILWMTNSSYENIDQTNTVLRSVQCEVWDEVFDIVANDTKSII